MATMFAAGAGLVAGALILLALSGLFRDWSH